MEIVVSNKTSRPLYEQISTQIKSQIMNGELKAGEALPSIRSLAKKIEEHFNEAIEIARTSGIPLNKLLNLLTLLYEED